VRKLEGEEVRMTCSIAIIVCNARLPLVKTDGFKK